MLKTPPIEFNTKTIVERTPSSAKAGSCMSGATDFQPDLVFGAARAVME